VAIQVLPGVQGQEVIRVVDEVIALIKSRGMHTVVTPFETVVEGDFYDCMELIAECQLRCIQAGAPSVMSYVKIAYNPGNGVWGIDYKTQKHQ